MRRTGDITGFDDAEIIDNIQQEDLEMKLSNKAYDILKWIAMYLLPAIGTLYFALSQIWGLPYGEQIVGTLAAVDTFLAAILGISTSYYNKELNG